METANLSHAASSILHWNEYSTSFPFPTSEVESEIAFCKRNTLHRVIAVNAIALECLPFCSKAEMTVIDQNLKEIAERI